MHRDTSRHIILGSIKGHSFLKSCLDWYKDKHFILADGTYYDKIISPAIYADIMYEYGFRYKDELQNLRDGMVIYPSYIFAGSRNEAEKVSYAVHCCNGSWRDEQKKVLFKIKSKLAKSNFLRRLLGKELYEIV